MGSRRSPAGSGSLADRYRPSGGGGLSRTESDERSGHCICPLPISSSTSGPSRSGRHPVQGCAHAFRRMARSPGSPDCHLLPHYRHRGEHRGVQCGEWALSPTSAVRRSPGVGPDLGWFSGGKARIVIHRGGNSRHFKRWRRSLSDVGAFDGVFAGLRDADGTRSVFVEAITPNLFPLSGTRTGPGKILPPGRGL